MYKDNSGLTAKWITPPIGTVDRKCSLCGNVEPYKFADRETDIYRFCPFCGAKMVNKEMIIVQSEHGFDYAITRVKDGYKMKRKGWNGKDQYIELATNVSFTRPNGEIVNVNHDAMGNKAIAFHGTSGVQLGWLASQADMLAEDWIEV